MSAWINTLLIFSVFGWTETVKATQPVRVVSLASGWTETIRRVFGPARVQIVGQVGDSLDLSPEIGTARTLSLEQVLRVKPSWIIVDENLNHQPELQSSWLKGVTFIHVSTVNIEKYLESVDLIGLELSRHGFTDALDGAHAFVQNFQKTISIPKAHDSNPPCAVGAIDPEMSYVVGGRGYLSQAIERAGFKNPFYLEKISAFKVRKDYFLGNAISKSCVIFNSPEWRTLFTLGPDWAIHFKNWASSELKTLNGEHLSKNSSDENVQTELRLYRILFGLLNGALIALCGLLMQTLFRNPLCDPYLLGIASTSSLGSLVYYFVTGSIGIVAGFSIGGLLGAALGSLVLWWFYQHSKVRRETLLLSGLVLSMMATSLVGYILQTVESHRGFTLMQWWMGDLGKVEKTSCLGLGIVFIFAVFWIVKYRSKLNIFALSEQDYRQVFRVPTRGLELIILALVSVLTAVSVSSVGLMGFVGLLVPWWIKDKVKLNFTRWAVGSAMLGGFVVVAADEAGRAFFYPREIPIGVLLAWVGTPILALLWFKQSEAIKNG